MFCYAGTTFFFVDVYVAWLTHICGIIHFNPDIIRPFHYWRYSAAQMPHLFFGDVHVAWLNRICDMTYFNSGIIQTFHYWRYTAVQKRIFFWRMDALCHTHDWVLSLQECAVVWAYVPTISHVTHVNKSCHRVNGSCHTQNWAQMPRLVLAYCVTWRIHIFVYLTWLIHVCGTPHLYVWHDPFASVIGRILCVWHHFGHGIHGHLGFAVRCAGTTFPLVCVMTSNHTHEWVMSHMWIRHVVHMNESCHTYECVMAHIWVIHVTRVNESCHTCQYVMSQIWMSHVTHVNGSCHTYEWVMSHL